jgi:general secretion pathway protein E
VVLIGEIRDLETAQIALQASLTGHLVLSTLHTNDAPNAVTRLVDMGMEAYKIASALRGVIAQRLMRRLCKHCCAPASEPVPERAARFVPPGTLLYRAVGCPECAMTGPRPLPSSRSDEDGDRATTQAGPDQSPGRAGPAGCGRSGTAAAWPGVHHGQVLGSPTCRRSPPRRTAQAAAAAGGRRAAAATALRCWTAAASSWWTGREAPRRRLPVPRAPACSGGGRGPAPPGDEGPAGAGFYSGPRRGQVRWTSG